MELLEALFIECLRDFMRPEANYHGIPATDKDMVKDAWKRAVGMMETLASVAADESD